MCSPAGFVDDGRVHDIPGHFEPKVVDAAEFKQHNVETLKDGRRGRNVVIVVVRHVWNREREWVQNPSGG